MPTAPNSQMPTPGSRSDPRIMESESDRVRINRSQSPPDPARKKSAKTQRKTSVHGNDYPTRQPWLRNRQPWLRNRQPWLRNRRSHSSDGISSDSDSRVSSSRRVQPSLKFPFDFKQPIAEEKVLDAAVPKVVRQSDHREAQEHRHQLYRESIQSYVHSRYADESYEREDSTIDLFTRSAREDKEDGQPELMTWM